MSWRRKLLVAPFMVYALTWSQPSFPAGAVAVGVPPDVAKQGFAAGHAVNAATMDEARQRAIEGCHKSVGASAAAMKLCNVVATFTNQCMAIAMDPKNGTPGVGWAIAETQKEADAAALTQCRNTAGPGRREFCTIDSRGINRACDGTAK